MSSLCPMAALGFPATSACGRCRSWKEERRKRSKRSFSAPHPDGAARHQDHLAPLRDQRLDLSSRQQHRESEEGETEEGAPLVYQ